MTDDVNGFLLSGGVPALKYETPGTTHTGKTRPAGWMGPAGRRGDDREAALAARLDQHITRGRPLDRGASAAARRIRSAIIAGARLIARAWCCRAGSRRPGTGRAGRRRERSRDDDDIADLIAGSAVAAGAAASRPVAHAGPRVVNFADVAAERVEWLWGGYLPLGKVVILDGDPGVGKSTVSLDIAARTSTASPMPDGSPGLKGSVLVLSAEDGLADTIRPRLDAAGADPVRVITITEIVYATDTGRRSRPVSIPGDLPLIECVIAEHDVCLVIVDVLVAYLSADVNAHRDQDVRRALHVLSGLAERNRCCVLVLRHLNKSGGGNALYRGGGSIGIIGAARAGFMCGRDPGDESGTLRVFACIKMNIAPEPPALGYRLVPDELHGCGRIEWLGESEHGAGDLLADPGRYEENADREDAREWLRKLLEGGPVMATEVYRAADAAGLSKDQAKRAKKKLRALAAKAGMNGPWYWALPEHEGDLTHLPEGSTKEAKSGEPQSLHASHPSVLPSADQIQNCTECGEPLDLALVDAGFTDHGEGEWP